MTHPAFEQATGTLYSAFIDKASSERPAILDGRHHLSYRELIRLVRGAANELAGLECQPGDRVLVMFPNSIEYIVAVFAVLSLDGVVVPVSPDIGAKRLSDILENTKPRWCLTNEKDPFSNEINVTTFCIDLATRTVHFGPQVSSTFKRGENTRGSGKNEEEFIRFTSGSTGHPKGVVLNHGHQLWIAKTLARVFRFSENHRELIIASMALSGGWQRVAATLLAGGCIVLPQAGPITVKGIFEDIEAHKISGFFTPPPLIRMMLRIAPEKVRTALNYCRTIEIGSASLSAVELTQLLALAPNTQIFVHYGLTECSRAVVLDASRHPDKLGTVGKPLPGVEIAIQGDSKQFLGANQPGRILVRGPQCTDEYFGDSNLNRKRFTRGWLLTGDFGMMDEDGFLTFLGRKDDLIQSGGHSFFAAEAERELGPVDGVVEYLIAGVADPRKILDQVPWVFVVPVDLENWSPQVLLAQARKRLPPYMIPRNVVSVPEIVLTPSGKSNRRGTVARYTG